jgi:pilus assembly protein Flp/PilA
LEAVMALNDKVKALKAAAEKVAERAQHDDELVERLVANPAATIAEVSGEPVPAGLVVTAIRNADGAVEINAKADPESDVELDDEALETVSCGTSAIEYGLIAAGISVAIIAVVNKLGGNLSSKFAAVGASLT